MKSRNTGVAFAASKSAGVIAAVGLWVLTAGSASASSVLTPTQANLLSSFDYSSYNVVNNTNVTLGGPIGQIGTYGSGQIDLIGTASNVGQILAAWCIDVFDDLGVSGNYNVIFNNFTNNGSAPSGTALTATQITEIGRLVDWGDANIAANVSNSAATQLAIWEVEYPTDSFVSSSGPVNTLVSTLVTEADNGTLGPVALLKEVVDPGSAEGLGNQGLVFQVGTTNALGTPLPSTWTMLIAGFISLGFCAYRGPKKHAAIAAS